MAHSTHLLHGKYLMVEVALKLLISQVDTKLLKAVPLKILKAKDVQDANVEMVIGGIGLKIAVQSGHNPAKQPGVQGLGERIPHIRCFRAIVSLVNCLT